MAAANSMLAARGLRMDVGFGCLQRIAAAGIAWQLSVRRETASEDGACSNNTKGRLGLQRAAAGCSAALGGSGAVHHRKDGADDNLAYWHDGRGYLRGWCNEMLLSGGRDSSVSDGVLGNRARLFFILTTT